MRPLKPKADRSRSALPAHARPWPALLATIAMAAGLIAAACSPGNSAVQSQSVVVPQPAGPSSEVRGARATAAPATAAPATTAPTAAPSPTAAPTATLVPTPAPSPTPALDLQRVKPNELGTIPILEFHVIADAEEDQWTRTPEHFRQDLEKLYAAGYRPISLGDFLANRISLPAGAKPVVLTFDDSSPGQFRYIKNAGGQVVVDPNSAVGMMEAFHAAHPDWALRALFSVLPEAEQPHKLFGQPEYETQKLRHLVEQGMDLANHSWWHQQLDIVSDTEVQRQLANAVRDVEKRVPGYRMNVLTLPLGLWPKNRPLALDGSFEGNSYHNDAVLLVGSDPAPAPNSVDYDPLALPRVQVFADNLDRWMAYLDKHPDEQYVSDGDPDTITFPSHLEPTLNRASVGTRTLRPY